MEDNWALRELAESLSANKEDESAKEELDNRAPMSVVALVTAMDEALMIVGRGREVLYGLLERRYGLRALDIGAKPGVYMSALRDVLGGSCDVIERFVLSSIREKTGVQARTLEEAAFKLRKRFGEA